MCRVCVFDWYMVTKQQASAAAVSPCACCHVSGAWLCSSGSKSIRQEQLQLFVPAERLAGTSGAAAALAQEHYQQQQQHRGTSISASSSSRLVGLFSSSSATAQA
jgi:hypothetical protein